MANPRDLGEDGRRRDSFLVAMYSQLWNNINRHITVLWESVGVLAGAFALFSLVEKETLSMDWACALMVLIAFWLVAHTYDANTWFHRNLVIIGNIERQFLRATDVREIHWYFTSHPKITDMLKHFDIQWTLGVAIGVMILVFHFSTRVAPGLAQPWGNLELSRSLPYVVAVLGIAWVYRFRGKRLESLEKLQKESPGISMSSD